MSPTASLPITPSRRGRLTHYFCGAHTAPHNSSQHVRRYRDCGKCIQHHALCASRPCFTQQLETPQFLTIRRQAGIRQKLAAEAAEANRRMSLARAHEAWQAAQAERAASDRALKAEVCIPMIGPC